MLTPSEWMSDFAIEAQVPLARWTTWYIGGPADYFFKPTTLASLQAFVQRTPELPKTLLGLGSNVLIRDGGIPGVVISLRPGLLACQRIDPHLIYVEGGVACAKVAKFCAKEKLLGASFLAGIPGTIGGALAMNAGAFGGETWSLVDRVVVLTESGALCEYPASAFQVSYRHIEGPTGLAFVGAYLRCQTGATAEAEAQIRTLLLHRKQTQPIGTLNAGSVFKNPVGDYAARLIESCALKGLQSGGARVCSKHANFILNEGHATAADVEQLIQWVQEAVFLKFGVQLIPEVKILGKI